jgi:ABC-type lipoprotein export system ATPase subunit
MNIKLKKINKYYFDQGKSTKALENISLEFNTDGSFVVITGESGAGKSSLIKVITGLEDYDEGEMYFDDIPVSSLSDKKKQHIYSDNISFVFQDYNLIESISCTQNIMLALIKQGKTQKEAKILAEKALKDVSLNYQKRMRVSKLSGGERQRVAIARSIALDTPIIVFDEPTGNLDDQTSKQIIEIISKISKNKLILYVTHDYKIVEKYVTRHIVLADSNLVKDEILQKPDSVENPQKTRSLNNKFSFISYLYSTYLIGFKHFGRTLATFVVLLFCFANVFGSLYIYGTMVTTIGTIGSLLNYDSYSTDTPAYHMGNVIKNSKIDISDEEIDYEGNYYIDYGDILGESVRIYSEDYQKNFDEDFANNDYYYYEKCFDYYDIYAIPYFTDDSDLVKSSEEDGIAIYIPDTWTSSSYYYETLDFIYNKDISISSDLWFDIASNYDPEFDGIPEQIGATQLQTKITSVHTYDSSINDSSCLYLVMNNEQLDTVRNSFLTEYDYLSFTDTFYFDTALSSSISINTGDEEYLNSSSNYYGISYYSDTTSNSLCLSADLIDKDLTIQYKNLELPLDYFDISYNLATDNTYAIFDRGLSKILAENQVTSTVYFDDVQTASENYLALSPENGHLYYQEYNQAVSSYKIDFESESSVIRQSYLISFLGTLLNLFIMSILIRFILNRFYYRKSYDQQVLSYIGFSFKNIVVVNLLQFLILGFLSIAVVFSLGVIFVPYAGSMFFANIWFLALAIFICLACSVFFGLPTRKKVIEND